MLCERRVCVRVLTAIFCCASPLLAAELTLEIDPGRSFLTANAFVKAVEAPTTGQGEGADFASYSGTITIDLDDFDEPTSIQFLSAEAIAAVTGDWLPGIEGGTEGDPGQPAPANFGIVLDAGPAGVLLGAFRDSVFNIESEDGPVADGSFSVEQSFITTQGFLDSNILSPVLGNSAGRDDTTGDTAINVSSEPGTYLRSADGVSTLTIPVDLDFLSTADDGVDFFFDGMIVATFGTPNLIPGDANGDGKVDAADLNLIGINWQQMGKVRSDGDFTGDGLVDAADLNVLALNWQTGVGVPSAVPEPSGMILLVGGAPLLLLRRIFVS